MSYYHHHHHHVKQERGSQLLSHKNSFSFLSLSLFSRNFQPFFRLFASLFLSVYLICLLLYVSPWIAPVHQTNIPKQVSGQQSKKSYSESDSHGRFMYSIIVIITINEYILNITLTKEFSCFLLQVLLLLQGMKICAFPLVSFLSFLQRHILKEFLLQQPNKISPFTILLLLILLTPFVLKALYIY